MLTNEVNLRGQLPVPLTPLIGRDLELEQLANILKQPAVRLLTITGPGGVGKTRLSLQLAANLQPFFKAVYFVPLASLSNPDFLISAIAQELDIKESAEQPLVERLKVQLNKQPTLLILDNFEQLVSAATWLSDLLAACAQLKIVVSSRATLQLSGEQEFPLSPLSLAGLANPQTSPALALLVQRLQAAKPTFSLNSSTLPVFVEICTRLNGLPLALELAAARLKLLPPDQFLARLDNQLNILTGGARDLPPRQQTLRASLDWSYNLLSGQERQIFGLLSVFRNGFTLDAALEVCVSPELNETDVLEGLAALLNQSLLTNTEAPGHAPRYLMLEAIRQYGWEQLQTANQTELAQDRLCRWALHLVQLAGRYLWDGLEQVTWLNRLDDELPNLRLALAWAVQRHPQIAVQLTSELAIFWDTRSYLVEGRQWLEQALAFAEQAAPIDRARLLFAASWLDLRWQHFALATERCQASLTLYRQLGDKVGELNNLLRLGWIFLVQGEIDSAFPPLQQALQLSQEVHNVYCQAAACSYLGLLALTRQDLVQAVALCEESVKLCRESGSQNQFLGWALTSLGAVALFRLDLQVARTYFLESSAELAKVGDRNIMIYNLLGLAAIFLLQDQLESAIRLFGYAAAMLEQVGIPLLPLFRQPYEQAIHYTKTRVSAERYQEFWQQGYTASSLDMATLLPDVLPPVTPLETAIASMPTLAGSVNSAVPTAVKPIAKLPEGLTAREVDVLRLLAEGLTNHQIAQRLSLSPQTVGSYLRTIYSKLDINSRSAATRFVLEHNLL